ncbi:MAG: CRISPR-associated protein Cas4 [Clostridiales Family XIII bacterium]|jgi:CRISPR-associated exonuclease Cas4|nr:CRISPR-associated protein Cas4 [Clostridiales Family XIII bacterium]
MYDYDDYVMISEIQHFTFCRRQWALIHLEDQWQENLRTVEGKILHEKTHETQSEVRDGVVITRGMQVFSHELGINGVCDTVEFRPDPHGVTLHGRIGTYKPVPVEYKRGKPKEHNADIFQLCAQAMCLEEMLVCEINEGFLFYGETRRRQHVILDESLRDEVSAKFMEIHEYRRRGYTPKVKPTKSCGACSLKDICLPTLMKRSSAKAYLNEKLAEQGDDQCESY